MRYAQALADWADAGGYEAEVALGRLHASRRSASRSSRPSGARCARCPAASRSGWCSRRCCAAPTRCCCSTSRTTTSTCRASAGSRSELRESPKTVLFVSHDRELLARAATAGRHASSSGAGGNTVWVHGGGFATYHAGAADRIARLEELRRRWDEEHAKLKALVLMYRSRRPRTTTAWRRRYQAARDPAAEVRGGRPAGGDPAASRTSRCGCAAGGPASAPSSARTSS